MAVILEGIEFESIWKVAHKWANKDFNHSDIANLDPFVKVRMQKMARAVMLKKLGLRNANNIIEMDSWMLINMLVDRKVFWNLRNCYFKNIINKDFLDSRYVSRSEVLRWCEAEYLSFPDFWIEDNTLSTLPEALKDKKISNRESDKVACRALASALWHIDPRIEPSHMAKSYFLSKYGNAQQYTDPKTVLGWITDLDPRPEIRTRHRPKNIEYLIDLKGSSGLNEKAVQELLKNQSLSIS